MMMIIAAMMMMMIFTVTITTNLLFLFATEVKFLRYSQGSISSKLLNWTGMDEYSSLMTQLTLCLNKKWVYAANTTPQTRHSRPVQHAAYVPNPTWRMVPLGS